MIQGRYFTSWRNTFPSKSTLSAFSLISQLSLVLANFLLFVYEYFMVVLCRSIAIEASKT